ncbi:hypothetical protein PGTUg99_027954 [Puccinia graminis f. sp. tritici]|uniref:Uncharacterized protein n=1 Tax=Puccinia graminis f. sp. tritici TaxID=56615 RepID=A0A5B0QM97_PUCGR|nr:hypothetical protein PGTUg99_027954 [Puccinia graminis f. sp. tritici]
MNMLPRILIILIWSFSATISGKIELKIADREKDVVSLSPLSTSFNEDLSSASLDGLLSVNTESKILGKRPRDLCKSSSSESNHPAKAQHRRAFQLQKLFNELPCRGQHLTSPRRLEMIQNWTKSRNQVKRLFKDVKELLYIHRKLQREFNWMEANIEKAHNIQQVANSIRVYRESADKINIFKGLILLKIGKVNVTLSNKQVAI